MKGFQRPHRQSRALREKIKILERGSKESECLFSSVELGQNLKAVNRKPVSQPGAESEPSLISADKLLVLTVSARIARKLAGSSPAACVGRTRVRRTEASDMTHRHLGKEPRVSVEIMLCATLFVRLRTLLLPQVQMWMRCHFSSW